MHLTLFRLPSVSRFAELAPALIGAGITLLIAAACWPVIPVATAVSLVALGATLAVKSRYIGTAMLRGALVAHLLVYSSLYLLFVGAIYDAAMRGPQRGLDLLHRLDMGLSIGVMLIVVRFSIAAIADSGDAPAR
jgi:hypothetical protein